MSASRETELSYHLSSYHVVLLPCPCITVPIGCRRILRLVQGCITTPVLRYACMPLPPSVGQIVSLFVESERRRHYSPVAQNTVYLLLHYHIFPFISPVSPRNSSFRGAFLPILYRTHLAWLSLMVVFPLFPLRSQIHLSMSWPSSHLYREWL